MSTPAASLEIAEPKLFTGACVIAVAVYGLVLLIPVSLAIWIMGLFPIGMAWSVLIPLLTILTTMLFLPLGLGNAHITRLVRQMNPEAGQTMDDFIVQITMVPRVRTGLRALLEDADDIGRLHFAERQLIFEGDSLHLTLPLEQVRQVRRQNIGLRGLFVYGPRIEVVVSGLRNVESVEFAERASWLLPTSRQVTRQLFKRLARAAEAQPPDQAKPSGAVL